MLFPIVFAKVESILPSSLPKLTRDSKILDFFKLPTADTFSSTQLQTLMLEKVMSGNDRLEDLLFKWKLTWFLFLQGKWCPKSIDR